MQVPPEFAYLGRLMRNGKPFATSGGYGLQLEGELEHIEFVHSVLEKVMPTKSKIVTDGTVPRIEASSDAFDILVKLFELPSSKAQNASRSDEFEHPDDQMRWNFPSCMKNARAESKRWFLRGMFDAFATIGDKIVLDYRWNAEDLVWIKSMLGGFGVSSAIKKNRLVVGDARSFFREIGTFRPQNSRKFLKHHIKQ